MVRVAVALVVAVGIITVVSPLRASEPQGGAAKVAGKALPWVKTLSIEALKIVAEATVSAVVQEKIVTYFNGKAPEPPQKPGTENSTRRQPDDKINSGEQLKKFDFNNTFKQPPLRWSAGTTTPQPLQVKPTERSASEVLNTWLKDRPVVVAPAPASPAEAFRRGYAFDSGRDGRRDPVQAETWYRQAAQQGHVVAQYYLAQLYYFGDAGISRDPVKAVHWLRDASERGFALAQTQLASAYETGDAVRTDLRAAAFWYGEAAHQGDPHAQYRLAVLYYYGNGVRQNFVSEFDWLNLAVDQGYPPAIRRMDERLDDLFEDARDGHGGAQYVVGKAFEHGVRGLLRRDYDGAAYWFDRARSNGSESARRALIALCEDRLIRCY